MKEKTAALTCERHGTATPLSCVRCETPICWACLVETDVGFMCEKHGGQARRARTLRSERRQRLVLGAGAVAIVVMVVLLARRVGDSGTGPPAPRRVVYEPVTDLIDNPDFEAGAGDGGAPVGWEVRSAGYQAAVDTDVRHGGAASGRISFVAASESTRLPPGLVRCFEADRLIGATVRLRSFLRSENASGSLTGLVIEVSGRRPDGSDGILNIASMRSLPIRGTLDWREYTLQLPVALSAERLCVGALLTGRGTLWLDDVVVEIAGGPEP